MPIVNDQAFAKISSMNCPLKPKKAYWATACARKKPGLQNELVNGRCGNE